MIAFFVPSIYPCTIGGMEIYYYHLVRELCKKDKIVLFTICDKFHPENCYIYHISASLFFIKKFNLGKLSMFITTFLKLLIHHSKISLIHLPCTSNNGLFGYFFPLLSKIFGIPYIIQFHGGGMRTWGKYDGNRLLFKHAARILAVSESIKYEYEKRTGREIEVVLPLIPYTTSSKSKTQLKQEYMFSENDKVIVMVGSIKPIKGNIWVYEEFRNLEANWIEMNRLRLLFVGKGSDSTLLKDMICRDRMKDKVRIIDHIPNDKIHEIYGLADYYMIASDFEGTPKSLIEALFNGLPVIGTNVNGINNIIKDRENGLLVNKTLPGELNDSIRMIVENKQFANNLGEMAKGKYHDKYNFSITLNHLVEIYNEYPFKKKA